MRFEEPIRGMVLRGILPCQKGEVFDPWPELTRLSTSQPAPDPTATQGE